MLTNQAGFRLLSTGLARLIFDSFNDKENGLGFATTPSGLRNVFPVIPPNWGKSSVYQPSKAQEIVPEGFKSKKPFYIALYAIGGYQLDNVLNETADALVCTGENRYQLLEEHELQVWQGNGKLVSWICNPGQLTSQIVQQMCLLQRTSGHYGYDVR